MTSQFTSQVKGYQVLERIGEGAYGAVYRAHQETVDREVAVKIILPEFANRPEFIRRFETEAQLVAQLEHIHIVPLYDYWRDPEGAYLVMRLMKGGSLEESLAADRLWNPEQAAQLVDQVASALEAAHQHGVVHRDLKPANILLDEAGNAYLSDFGIAKELGGDSTSTATDAILGTPAYITPEQVQSQPVTPQTDIYALGVLLYELLVGEHPFPDSSTGELVVKHLNEPLPYVREARPELPAALDGVIQRATAKNPADRYPSALSLAEDFRRALQLEVEPAEVSEAELYNPYKGLRAFQETDSDDFFGREALTGQLLAQLAAPGQGGQFLAVVGPSGSGKSSVVKAGLLPALRKGALPGSDQWFIVEMHPGTHPLKELQLALLGIAADPQVNMGDLLSQDKDGLKHAAWSALPGKESELLLVIDQFEELFILVEDESMRSHFLDCLHSAVTDPEGRVRVAVTLRADFYDRPLMYPNFGHLVEEHTAVVLPLSPEEIQQAIQGPADRVGVVLEKGLVPAITADVADQPGTLPLLQYALTELFERREGRMLTNQAYQVIGGVLGALGRRAEEVYRALGTGEKEVARQLFLRLVTLGEGAEDTRRRILRSEIETLPVEISGVETQHIASLQVMGEVIDFFGEARLLSFDRDPTTRSPTVEVAHEALFREWQRLREWLDENRADIRMQRILTNAAAEWLGANLDASFLLRGSRLVQFEDWASRSVIALTHDERNYLEASLDARQVRETKEAMRREHEQKQISIGLASQALLELEGSVPERGVLLALEALENYPYTWQARRALGIAVLNHKLDLNLVHEGGITFSDLSRDGRRLLTSSKDDKVRIWDTQSGQEELVISEVTNPYAFWSPDESKILILGGNEQVGWWFQIRDSISGALQLSQTLDSRWFYSVILNSPWSPSGERFVTGHHDGSGRIWDAASGVELFRLSGHEGATAVEWSPSGDLVVTNGIDEPKIIMWEAATGIALYIIPATQISPFRSWSPIGDRFTTREIGKVCVYQSASGEKLLSLDMPGVSSIAAEFSPDGSKLITTGHTDGTARMWDAQSGMLLSLISGMTQGLAAAWSPSGKLAAVGAGDGLLRIWDISSGLVKDQFQFPMDMFFINWSPEEDRVFVAGTDHSEVRVNKLSRALLTIPGPGGGSGGTHWSPDGQQFTRGYHGGMVKIWEASSGEEVFTFHCRDSIWGDSNWSPSGDRIMTFSPDSPLCIYDAVTGDLLIEYSLPDDSLFDARWSPDGSQIASTTWEEVEKVVIWDAATLTPVKSFPVRGGAMIAAWSPDGKRLVTTSKHGEAAIRDAATGEVLRQLFPLDYTDFVEGVTWTKDGEQVIVFSGGVGHRFDTATGEELMQYTGHTGTVFTIVWSPDEDLIFTFGADGTARVFEVATGAELLVYQIGAYTDGALSPDGTQVLIASGDGNTYIFPTWLTSEDLIAYAKENCLIGELTSDERDLFGLPPRE